MPARTDEPMGLRFSTLENVDSLYVMGLITIRTILRKPDISRIGSATARSGRPDITDVHTTTFRYAIRSQEAMATFKQRGMS